MREILTVLRSFRIATSARLSMVSSILSLFPLFLFLFRLYGPADGAINSNPISAVYVVAFDVG